MTKKDKALLALLLADAPLHSLAQKTGRSYQGGTTYLLQLVRAHLRAHPELRDRAIGLL